VVKIPWENLYTKPTVAKIEGLQAIIVPSRGVDYNEDGLMRVEDHEAQGWVAWAASFLPFGSRGAGVDGKTKIVSEIERAWNAGEKSKLYAAINYQVSAHASMLG